MNTLLCFLLLILAFLSPTLAFVSVNRDVCSIRQIFLSSLLSLVLALLLGLGLHFAEASNLTIASLSLVIFLALLERTFSRLLAKTSTCLITVSIIFLVGLTLAYISPYLLLILFLAHFSLSCYDLSKNWYKKSGDWHKPFSFFECGDQLKEHNFQAKEHEKFAIKPNIYILFLESMQSKAAVKDLYNIDDAGLEEWLKEQNFQVCPYAYSSNSHTKPSLRSLLNMMPIHEKGDSFQPIPEAFEILKKNDYQIGVFDISPYVFESYIPYLDSINFDLPTYVKKLYSWFMPFFMQSRFARALILCNKDIYSTNPNFQDILHDVQHFLEAKKAKEDAKEDKDNHCLIIRFGATHAQAPEAYSWDNQAQRAWWQQFYPPIYQESIKDIKTMLEYLIKVDPDACILITGDHGTMSLAGIYGYQESPTEANQRRGIDLHLAARDLSEVLVACRCPKVNLPILQEPFSHANAMRDIFSSLGLSANAMSKRAQAMTIFYECITAKNYIITKDGKTLDEWQMFNAGIALEFILRYFNKNIDYLEVYSFMIEFLCNLHRIPEAMQIIELAQQKFKNDPRLASFLLPLLLRWNFTNNLEQSLNNLPLANDDANIRFLRIQYLLLACKDKEAKAIKNTIKSFCLLGLAKYIHLTIMQSLLNKDWSSAMTALKFCPLHSPDLDNEQRLMYSYICIKNNNVDKARKIVDIIKTDNETIRPQMILASLHSNTFDFKLRAEDAKLAIKQQQLVTAPHFYLAGCLEMLGEIESARDILVKLYQKTPNLKNVIEQLGLFCLRHGFKDMPKNEQLVIKQITLQEMQKKRRFLETYHLFDQEWYQKTYAEILGDLEPMRHFLNYHLLLSLSPNALLDATWILIVDSINASVGVYPLESYLTKMPESADLPSLTFWPMAFWMQHPEFKDKIHPILAQINLNNQNYN